MDSVENHLKEARSTLLDLSMRNQLLNFRPSKRRTISVVDELPREIYDILVLKGRPMQFMPRPASLGHELKAQYTLEPAFDDVGGDDEAGLSRQESSNLWQPPPSSGGVAQRHVDRFLQTAIDSESLQKRLFYIYHEYRSVLEETGYPILYLAIGFLEWTESPDSLKKRRAPLLLVPLELDRAKVGTSFKMRWSGEDIATNISLQEALSQQRIGLPEFEMPDVKQGVDGYFESVVAAVRTMPDWQVLSDIYLGFFSFTKFTMYKDLDPGAWPEGESPADDPLIRALFDPCPESEFDVESPEGKIEGRVSPRDACHVMDADSSQVAVIEAVKRGRNLVVEGPPGTGKSQTIANTIAELLVAGKSVLFVSEKMAALEVVKSRLDKVHLGDSCLELHSRKSRKDTVLGELKSAIEAPSLSPVSLEEELEKLESLECDLDGYAEALHEPFGKLGRSPFDLFGMSESSRRHFCAVERSMSRVELQGAVGCDQTGFQLAETRLNELVAMLPLVGPLRAHPWRGCTPGIILPADEEAIGQRINEAQDRLCRLEASLHDLVEACAIMIPTAVSDIPLAIRAAWVLAESRPVDQDVLLNAQWDQSPKEAEALILDLGKFADQRSRALATFKEEALDEDIVTILKQYEVLSTKSALGRLLSRKYRRCMRVVAALYNDRPPKQRGPVIGDLRRLARLKSRRDMLRQVNEAGAVLFGSYWQADRSDPQTLCDLEAWLPSFRQLLREGAITESAVEMVGAGISRQQVGEAIREADAARQQFVAERDRLAERLGIDYVRVFGASADDVPFTEYMSRFQVWRAEMVVIQRWALFADIRQKCLQSAASPLVALIDQDMLHKDDIIPCLKGNFADALISVAFRQREPLAIFVGIIHDRKIEAFKELDTKVICRNRHRLAWQLRYSRPQVSGGASPASEAGILLRQFSLKRRHMSIRNLMSSCGGLIQRIKPCFMMSPLSIAQFLDPKNVRFDVVIFDEASQVKPADALGALLRGSQVVVMGDTRQLPPTAFFDRMLQSGEDDSEDLATYISDVGSILDLCKTSFPTKTLLWHYRSRHESLIATSNQEFYENRLLVFPSATEDSEELGLKFVHLPNAIYDRGRSQVNRIEARAVAEACVEQYLKHPDKSLGVGAFNVNQQEAILQEIELQLRLQPEMEAFFDTKRQEHFFVKNLETIQGDERDVIFLSIGFGFDADRHLTLQFGPLTHEGGERRLNVLITRAREKCVVFSNFRAADMPLDASHSVGLRALRDFLGYAENGILRAIEPPPGGDFDSPFESSVYDLLRAHGHEMRSQVGCAGFRVDLAVVDPNRPGRYMLGIECDGAKYHSSRVARDRDRLRQVVLEDRGWHIHRVWSTDWYRDRDETERTLLEAVEQAKLAEATSVAVDERSFTSALKPSGAPVLDDGIDVDQRASFSAEEATPPETISEYQVCSSLLMPRSGQLHEQPTRVLAKAVAAVVSVEGPVHSEEVVRRIRALWGLNRSGHRIQQAIEHAISAADASGSIRRVGDFLWHGSERPIVARHRSVELPPNIDMICDEEIAEAIKFVLKTQFATSPDQLTVSSCRLLGIRAAHSRATERVRMVLQSLLAVGTLRALPNGMVDFA